MALLKEYLSDSSSIVGRSYILAIKTVRKFKYCWDASGAQGWGFKAFVLRSRATGSMMGAKKALAASRISVPRYGTCS